MGEIASARMPSAFNSALETGLRALILLVEAFPQPLDLQRLVQFDYITLHSEDAGGPRSLHPPLPMRSGELTVRRGLIERGLLLMISRGLVTRLPSAEDGFVYLATDDAGPFMSNLQAAYTLALQESARWTITRFAGTSADELRGLTSSFFKRWSTEFDTLAHPGPLFER